MNLKASSLNRSPAPGTQQQQQAEALSKQRAQQAQAQANSAAQNAYSMASQQYQSPGHPPSVYGSNNMYSPSGGHGGSHGGSHPGAHAGNPPAYGAQPNPYSQVPMNQVPAQMPAGNYGGVTQQPGMYQQAVRRQRASTMEQQQSGIPAAIQRVASHLDPNAPIRLQPSPAYYPPPPDGVGLVDQAAGRAGGRRGSQQQGRARSNRDFIRTLEERTLEEGYGQNNHWGH